MNALEEEEEPGTYEEEEGEDVLEGLDVGVCKGVSAGNKSRSISEVVSVGDALLLLSSSCV